MSRRTGRRQASRPSPPGLPSQPPINAGPEPEVIDIPEEQMLLGMFIGALDAGRYDDKLEVIAKWVHRRIHEAEEERAGRALAGFRLGDEVVFTALTSPPCLRGMAGDIVAFHARKAVVRLGAPIREFPSGIVQCSPRDLFRLHAGRTEPTT